MDNKSVTLLAIAFVIVVVIGLAAVYALSGNNSMKVFSARNNSQTITVKAGENFKISLDENPTTGYSWNVSVTSGLTIVNDTFTPPGGGLVGAGGVHEWQVKAAGTGDQKFSGIYKRPWEPTFGNETTFMLNVRIA